MSFIDPNPIEIMAGEPVAGILEFVESVADDPNYKTPGADTQYVFAFGRPTVGQPFVVLAWPVGIFITSEVKEVADPTDNAIEFKTRNTKYRLQLVPRDFAKQTGEAAN